MAASGGRTIAAGSVIEVDKLEAVRLVSFGSAEYVVEQKEEKQVRQTKEDKTATKRQTK